MTCPPLLVNDLVKTYRGPRRVEVKALRGISLTIERGTCLGLLGANGAGKSTAIACITGLFPATQGTVQVEGFDVYRQPKQARRFLGVCPQEDSLDDDYSVEDQLILHAGYFRIDRREGRRRAQALLRQFRLESRHADRIDTLSGGMRRLLQVARALVSEPTVLVLDEPTTGLDPDVRLRLWAGLQSYRERGGTVLLTTHYMEEAERLCDRIALIDRGLILDEGTVSELVARYLGGLPPPHGATDRAAPGLEAVYLKLAGGQLAPLALGEAAA